MGFGPAESAKERGDSLEPRKATARTSRVQACPHELARAGDIQVEHVNGSVPLLVAGLVVAGEAGDL
eukprot:3685606-Lingulodinium_polyedra.AAC.1